MLTNNVIIPVSKVFTTQPHPSVSEAIHTSQKHRICTLYDGEETGQLCAEVYIEASTVNFDLEWLYGAISFRLRAAMLPQSLVVQPVSMKKVIVL